MSGKETSVSLTVGDKVAVKVSGSHGGFFIRYGTIVLYNDLTNKIKYQYTRIEFHHAGTVTTTQHPPITTWTSVKNIVS